MIFETQLVRAVVVLGLGPTPLVERQAAAIGRVAFAIGSAARAGENELAAVVASREF
jgi:hypothetical protein